MRGVAAPEAARPIRGGRRPALVAALVAVLAAPAAGAFEFFDGRLQVNGYLEEQVRGLANDFNFTDDYDLAQWYHVLDVELEYDFAPDGWGPFDVLSGFVRLEGRYDCVWSHACALFPSANAFGNRANHLPKYKITGRRPGISGWSYAADSIGPYVPGTEAARYTAVEPRALIDPRTGIAVGALLPRNPRKPARIDQIPGFSGLFPIAGVDQVFQAGGDDPAYFYFADQLDCKFGVRNTPGGSNGRSFQIIGPINPRCQIDESVALSGKPNPFNPDQINPITGTGGSGEMPARPAMQGLAYQSGSYTRWRNSDKLDNPRVDFGEGPLSFNHGSSQRWERELKEAYLDMEFLDSRLWVRAGRQSIVWGKTELFRTTDQFNPQDLALASLPSLEESRVALWSVRGVWSFYDVGPAQDVRLEVAFNFDNMEPADIGRCGEPFTALVACNKTFGLWLHGLTGFALAGEDRPEDPWESLEGLEIGARLEFRLGRFSFQISDWYGYDDFPYLDQIAVYSRSVDPLSGRPLRADAGGPCTTGTEPSCLPIVSTITTNGNTGTGPDGSIVDPANRQNVIDSYAGNLQLFGMICATSIGFNAVDPTACGQSIFNSRRVLPALTNVAPRSQAKTLPTVSALLSNALAGNTTSRNTIAVGFTGGVVPPLVPLNVDPCDGQLSDGQGGCPTPGRTASLISGATPSLNETTTAEQQALLGCGQLWGTDCEGDGIDLLNADAGTLMQSFLGFEGTPFVVGANLSSGIVGTVNTMPGTIGTIGPAALPFRGGQPGALYDTTTDQLVITTGTRGPFDDLSADGIPDFLQDLNGDGVLDGQPAGGQAPRAYNPNQDGCVGPVAGVAGCAGSNVLQVPAGFGASTGLQFKTEMAALSFNFQAVLVAFSSPPSPVGSLPSNSDEFDPSDPYSTDPNQCSFVQPQYCGSVVAFFDITGAQRQSIRARGNGTYGRRDFVWHTGAEGVLRYEKRNVLGFSGDFAEDVTKSNWGFEATWIEGNQFNNNDEYDGISKSSTLNFTISADRPTFINFLNQNRTFFFNSQWFFQYATDYRQGFTSNGPINVLGTFTIQTGYFQDRLLPNVTFVYDIQSRSGAALPSITYRFTENFSGTLGLNFFSGRWQKTDMPITPVGTAADRAGRHAYKDPVETGLSVVHERDELYLRLRYTF